MVSVEQCLLSVYHENNTPIHIRILTKIPRDTLIDSRFWIGRNIQFAQGPCEHVDLVLVFWSLDNILSYLRRQSFFYRITYINLRIIGIPRVEC